MRAVVVGAGFIGMEAAASLTERGLVVTVVAPDAVPLGRALGAPIGQMFRDIHEKHGVRFRLGARVERFEAKAGGGAEGGGAGAGGAGGGEAVGAAVLAGGERLEAEVVLVAVGIEPNTEFLRGEDGAKSVAGVNDDGTLNVDERLRLLGRDGRPVGAVWAAGDVTRFPNPQTGEPVHIEHWRVAQQHGRAAAFEMAGVPNPASTPGPKGDRRGFGGTPYFWTFQFGVGLDYVGFAHAWDEIVVDGDIAKQDFTAYYVRGGKVLAAAGCGRSRQMGALAELMRLGRTPGAEAVRGATPDFVQMLAEVGRGTNG